MTINRMICKAGLLNNPNKPLKSIEFVTVHCTGSYASTATAKNHAIYVNNGSGGSQASFHYCVDSTEIWQMFEDTQGCWHCGDGGNGTGNTTSIGIEVCVNDRAGFRQACLNAAWLVAELLKRHKLTIDKVVQHHRWSGKGCPAELRSGAWGVTWMQFIEMVKSNMGAESSPSALYRIQLAAFSNKENCDNFSAKIRKLPDTIGAGYSNAYVVTVNGLYKVQVAAMSKRENAQKIVDDLKRLGYESFITT